jgi:hypothetical protein
MMDYLKQFWGDKLWENKWKQWQADEKWMNLMHAANGNDVLAMVNSKGDQHFYKFEGEGEDLLTGATEVNDLIGTKLAGVSIFLEDLRHRQLGNNAPGQMIEAGLWRVANGHLSMEYHDDPRIWAKSSEMTRAERDAWVGTYSVLETTLNFLIPTGTGWVKGALRFLQVSVSAGENIATGDYMEDNGYKVGIDEWYIERTGIDHNRGWYDGSNGSLHKYP